MIQPVAKPFMTPEEYLALEASSDELHEYLDGQVYLLDPASATDGARPKHNLVTANIVRAFSNALVSRPCLVLVNKQRVYIEATGLATYPDVLVVCETPQYDRRFRHSITNPGLVVEVVSPSTEGYDRGTKFRHYARLPSLKEILLIATEGTSVDHFVREANGSWRMTAYESLESAVRCPSLDIEVRLTQIYEKVELLGQDDEPSPHPPRVTAARSTR